MSSPSTGGEPNVTPPTNPPVPPGTTEPPPAQPPAQPPAAPPAAPPRESSRDVIAALNALPEKIANVLLERNPVATPPNSSPQNPTLAQGDAQNSPSVGVGAPAGQSSPGQGQGAVPPVTASPPAGASTSKKTFAEKWFGV